MTKLPRVIQKVFGLNSGAVNNFNIFGSLQAGTPISSKDPAAIQSLGAWLLGWAGSVVGNKSPCFEEMNSAFYVAFYQLSYLFQAGLPEYESSTSYYVGSICQVAGVPYISKTNDNVAHDPTLDTNNWRDYRSLLEEFKYPVGEVYQTHRSGDPSVLLGFGTWSRIATGQVPVGLDPGDTDFDTIGKTGGAKTVSLTDNQNGRHAHFQDAHTVYDDGDNSGIAQAGSNSQAKSSGTGRTVSFSGNGDPHQNMPPYNVLFNYWLRIA